MAGAVRSRAISGRPGFVIAAPYGTSDPHTGALAAELARRTGFALQVELPRTARTQWQELYIAVLAEFLAEAVALPASS